MVKETSGGKLIFVNIMIIGQKEWGQGKKVHANIVEELISNDMVAIDVEPHNAVKIAVSLQLKNFMNEPILYLLVRNDLQSLNPGKAMAQVSHATNAFMKRTATRTKALRKVWQASTPQGFGTALVLAASLEQVERAVNDAVISEDRVIADTLTDPTYPYVVSSEIADLISTGHDTLERRPKGGEVLLHREEITCAYIFGNKTDCQKIIGHLKLHP